MTTGYLLLILVFATVWVLILALVAMFIADKRYAAMAARNADFEAQRDKVRSHIDKVQRSIDKGFGGDT